MWLLGWQLDGSNSPFILEGNAILEPYSKHWTQLLGDLLQSTTRWLCQRYIVQVYRCFMFCNKKMKQQKREMAHGLCETLLTDVSEVFCVCCSCKNISGNLSFLPKKEKLWDERANKYLGTWRWKSSLCEIKVKYTHCKVSGASKHLNIGVIPVDYRCVCEYKTSHIIDIAMSPL